MGVRVSQVVLEATAEPSARRVRVSQVVLEATAEPSARRVRVSQVVLEALVKPGGGSFAGEPGGGVW